MGYHSRCKECTHGTEKYVIIKLKKAKVQQRLELKEQGKGLCNICDKVYPLEEMSPNPGHPVIICRWCTQPAFVEKMRKQVIRKELFEQGKKECNNCNTIKSLEDFPNLTTSVDGKHSHCTICFNNKTVAYRRKKMASDPTARLKRNYRARTALAFKHANIEKPSRTVKLLGCTYQEAWDHVEALFVDGMTWDNMGKLPDGTRGWVLDHSIPLKYFDLSIEAECYEAFNYKNLQPLWNKDNMAKASYYKGHYLATMSRKEINELRASGVI